MLGLNYTLFLKNILDKNIEANCPKVEEYVGNMPEAKFFCRIHIFAC